MKTYTIHSAILSTCVVALFSGSHHLAAQITENHSSRLGLPRLGERRQPDLVTVLESSKFAEEPLAGQGARAAEKHGVKTLALDPARDWSRPLRGNPGDTVFVSLLIYGSAETVIEVGGVVLGVLESPVRGYGSLEARDASGKWQSLGLSVPLQRFDGKLLAALPVLTVRLDPQASVYDVFVGSVHLADNLPYDPDKGPRKVTVLGGEAGAMIMGLVQADENPLYEDANVNGIDDRFEQQKNNRLQAASASVAERKALAKDWREHQARNPSAAPALFLKLPQPDK